MRTLLTVLSLLPLVHAPSLPPSRIDLRFDTTEAEAVLDLLDKRASRAQVGEPDWRRLFTTEPYVRLKAREAQLQREFTDAEFTRFVLEPQLLDRRTALRRTLGEWRKADLTRLAERVLAYLPAEARMRAKVYPVIKPKPNSFVFGLEADPAIFLYLDPDRTRDQVENVIAHELHHIGLASLESNRDTALRGLSPRARTAAGWIASFGEGIAMLAAAGGPDVHPHLHSPADDRRRWDNDLQNFASDLKKLEVFFLDVVHGRLTTPEIDKVAFSFFGVQGPWYTVGWNMAAVVERRHGRAALIECMTDPRLLLVRYNSAARELAGKEPLPLWSEDLLTALGAQTIRD